jgi:hypothetical protein
MSRERYQSSVSPRRSSSAQPSPSPSHPQHPSSPAAPCTECKTCPGFAPPRRHLHSSSKPRSSPSSESGLLHSVPSTDCNCEPFEFTQKTNQHCVSDNVSKKVSRAALNSPATRGVGPKEGFGASSSSWNYSSTAPSSRNVGIHLMVPL